MVVDLMNLTYINPYTQAVESAKLLPLPLKKKRKKLLQYNSTFIKLSVHLIQLCCAMLYIAATVRKKNCLVFCFS